MKTSSISFIVTFKEVDDQITVTLSGPEVDEPVLLDEVEGAKASVARFVNDLCGADVVKDVTLEGEGE